jgi:hypothetical protein
VGEGEEPLLWDAAEPDALAGADAVPRGCAPWVHVGEAREAPGTEEGCICACACAHVPACTSVFMCACVRGSPHPVIPASHIQPRQPAAALFRREECEEKRTGQLKVR